MAQRDSKGRFIPGTGKTPAVKKSRKGMEIGDRLNAALKSAAEVFITKAMDGETVKISGGTQIVAEKLGDGSIRMKRENSPRTFYCTEADLKGVL